MEDDTIREHIARLAASGDPAGLSLTARVASGCWPGGSADRTQPIARHWLRRWRPVRAATALPVCSCATGRCAVCN